ncbi:hypothetical protein GCM10027278_14840 [Paralcaligenes ginsengisoli]
MRAWSRSNFPSCHCINPPGDGPPNTCAKDDKRDGKQAGYKAAAYGSPHQIVFGNRRVSYNNHDMHTSRPQLDLGIGGNGRYADGQFGCRQIRLLPLTSR